MFPPFQVDGGGSDCHARPVHEATRPSRSMKHAESTTRFLCEKRIVVQSTLCTPVYSELYWNPKVNQPILNWTRKEYGGRNEQKEILAACYGVRPFMCRLFIRNQPGPHPALTFSDSSIENSYTASANAHLSAVHSNRNADVCTDGNLGPSLL